MLNVAPERFRAFLVQRELCGLRNHEQVIRELGVPRELLNRGGVFRPSR